MQLQVNTGPGILVTAPIVPPNPSHVYKKSGIYNVKLIFSDGFCFDTIVKKQSIVILAAPKPGFTVNNSSYCTPFDLKVTDASIGSVKIIFYDFGDGYSGFNLITKSSIFLTWKLYGQANPYRSYRLRNQRFCFYTCQKGCKPVGHYNSYTLNVMDQKDIKIDWQPDSSVSKYENSKK